MSIEARMLGIVRSQFFRYLAVGGWNTVFGIGLYWLAYRLFGHSVHYLLLAVPVNILAITNAFLCYKLIVFRTKGNWLREYVKCYLVYGGGVLVSIVLLWLLVDCFGMSPTVANLIGNVIVVAASYFGHKYFSFCKGHVIGKRSRPEADCECHGDMV